MVFAAVDGTFWAVRAPKKTGGPPSTTVNVIESVKMVALAVVSPLYAYTCTAYVDPILARADAVIFNSQFTVLSVKVSVNSPIVWVIWLLEKRYFVAIVVPIGSKAVILSKLTAPEPPCGAFASDGVGVTR